MILYKIKNVVNNLKNGILINDEKGRGNYNEQSFKESF